MKEQEYAEKNFNIEDKRLIGYVGKEKKVIIPNNIDEIETSAFVENETIEEVVIPDNIIYIGNAAFAGCTALKKVVFNHINKPMFNGSGIFEDCVNLKILSFPDWRSLWNYRFDTGGEPFKYGASLYIAGRKIASVILTADTRDLRALSGIEGVKRICFEDKSPTMIYKRDNYVGITKKEFLNTLVNKYPQIEELFIFESKIEDILLHIGECQNTARTEDEFEYQIFSSLRYDYPSIEGSVMEDLHRMHYEKTMHSTPFSIKKVFEQWYKGFDFWNEYSLEFPETEEKLVNQICEYTQELCSRDEWRAYVIKKIIDLQKEKQFEARYNRKTDPIRWDANVGRKNRIARYRSLAQLKDNEVIQEDNIDDWALKRVCVESGKTYERVKAELLGQKYTGYEEN